MRRVCGARGLPVRLLSYGLIAAGILLLLIFVPYVFWVALLGLLLTAAGLILLKL